MLTSLSNNSAVRLYRWLIASVVLAVLVTPAMAERPYTPGVTVERAVDTHDVRADGSDRETNEVVYRVETAQGISDAGAQRIEYRSSIDDVESIEASTIKPDGTEIKVLESTIRTQDEDSNGGSTEFSDTKYKVIVFPAVEVGGRVRYRVTINHRTTPYPGFFSDEYVLAPQWNWEHWEANVNIPTGLPLYVGQIPTKERKVPQGGLVFQHVNARVGIGPKFLNRSCASDPIGLCRVPRALATHPNDRRW
jgi:Domain of Unknown Function with PDB structure (DUF3857)